MVHRNTLCPHKIQDICIFQIVNKIRINKGQMGYEMETSEFLTPSLFCNTSKNTRSNMCKGNKLNYKKPHKLY